MAARRGANLTPWLGIALAVIVLDQLTKAMIVATFQLGDARMLLISALVSGIGSV